MSALFKKIVPMAIKVIASQAFPILHVLNPISFDSTYGCQQLHFHGILEVKEDDVIRIMREHLEGLFPKVCSNCGRRFATLREYLLVTEHKDSAMPYDADMGDWKPINPLGTFTYASCPCVNTLALSSRGMPLSQLWPLLA